VFSKFFTQTLSQYISSLKHFLEKLMMDSWPAWKIEQDRALFRTIWLRFENFRFHHCSCVLFFIARKKKDHRGPLFLQIKHEALDRANIMWPSDRCFKSCALDGLVARSNERYTRFHDDPHACEALDRFLGWFKSHHQISSDDLKHARPP
jgi:hypothetical protein